MFGEAKRIDKREKVGAVVSWGGYSRPTGWEKKKRPTSRVGSLGIISVVGENNNTCAERGIVD